MYAHEIRGLAEKLISDYSALRRKIVTAESCTGGLISGVLTEIAGSSSVFERGFVTYSNDAKIEVLAVQLETLQQFGAVSAEVAEEMAQGALEFSQADVALSVTGIAGPEGGTFDKPVGLVYFGLANRDGLLMHYRCEFSGDRSDVRMKAIQEGLRLLASLNDETASGDF
jgi:nicotinamide-nucleotide amidase